MIDIKEIGDIKNSKRVAAALAIAVMFTIIRIFAKDLTYSVEKNLFSVAILFFLIYPAFKKINRGTGIYLGAFSLIFTFFVSRGGGYSRAWWSYLLLLPFMVIFILGTANIVDSVDFAKVKRPVNKKVWAIYFLLILALWLPVFLAAGPLKISEDSSSVISEALGNLALSDQNPVLYTIITAVFLKPFNSIGMVMVGAYAFGLFQICAIAAILAYSLYYIEKAGCHRIFVWFGILYFTLTPVFALNAMTVWKDIPYNAVLLLLMIKLYEVAKTKGEILKDRKYTISFAVICILTCFLRGNGFFIVVGTGVALFLALKPHRRYILLLFIPLLLAVKVIQGPVYSAIGIKGLGVEEAQAMPLQMVARAVIDGTQLTQRQEEIISGIMPIDKLKEVYVSSSVDFIKFSEHFNSSYFQKNNKEFLLIWLQLAPKNIKSYVSAWLGETVGYWQLGFGGDAALSNDMFNGHEGIFYKDVIKKFTGFNAADWFFARREFISLAVFSFLALFTAFYKASRERYLYILPVLPLLFTWVGLMVGAPTYCSFRYMLVFPYALPFSLFMLFDKSK